MSWNTQSVNCHQLSQGEHIGALSFKGELTCFNSTTNITSPNGVPIRYKEVPSGICEMNPSVKSYAGYVATTPTQNTFFYCRSDSPRYVAKVLTYFRSLRSAYEQILGANVILSRCEASNWADKYEQHNVA